MSTVPITVNDPFNDLLTAGSGPIGEAKTTTVSNWFYWLGTGITDALDGRQVQPVANAGVNLGVGNDGNIYVQGSAGGAGQAAQAARFSVSPSVLLIAGLVFLLLRKKG